MRTLQVISPWRMRSRSCFAKSMGVYYAHRAGPPTRGAAMKSLKAVFAAGVLVLSSLPLQATSVSPPIARIVAAADAFLATLDDTQRKKVVYAFNDADQRARWSNLPVAMVSRGGISLKEMTAPQKAAALKLLATTLSPAGYEKVQQIMEGDEINQQQSGRRNSSAPMFGRDLFYLSMLG